MSDSYVSIVKTDCFTYPKADTLFRPDTNWPEYPFADISQEKNEVYSAVREALHLLKLDEEHYGTQEWNPLGEIVTPGNYVLLKPNLVMDVNKNRNGGTECLYTQPAVVAAVIDYVWIALQGTGRIVVGDAPMQECNFDRLAEESGYDVMTRYYRNKGVPVELADFRQLSSTLRGGVHHNRIDADAKGRIVHLDEHSEFAAEDPSAIQKMRVTNYDPRIMNGHHNKELHEYFVSDYVLNADVIINLPKPKSHRKAGFTAALKNLVGINTRKEYLPHHTKGPLNRGGDEYFAANPVYALRSMLLDKRNIFAAENHFFRAQIIQQAIRCCTILQRLSRQNYSEGSWYGNHTISRTITDLNKIIFYADKMGIMQPHPVRKMFIVADMIVSGEKEGPVDPSPKDVGIIAAGQNPVCFDEVICTLMGFDKKAVPTLRQVRAVKDEYVLSDAEEEPLIVSNTPCYNGKRIEEVARENLLDFIPTAGWKGHIEMQ